MDPDPGQKVASTPELLDKIFELVDMKTVMKCRTVCRQWRSVSELYLKRRMSITVTNPSVLVMLESSRQEVNLFNNRFQLPEDQFSLILKPMSASNRSEFSSNCCSTLFAMVVNLEWISSVVIMNLSGCLTVDDWIVAGRAILKKMKALSDLKLQFRAERSRVVPLCFYEIKSQSDENEMTCEKMRRIEFVIEEPTFSKRRRFGSILEDTFDLCTNLVNLKLTVPRFLCVRVTRRANFDDAGVEFMQEWKCWIWSSGWRCHPFSPQWLEFIKDILTKAKPPKLDIPVVSNVLAVIAKTPSVTQQLEKVHLSMTSPLFDRKPESSSSLLSTTAFEKVKVLTLSYFLCNRDNCFPSMSPVSGFAAFPSLETLQLYRDKNFAVPLGGSVSSYEVHKWMCSNLAKMAPKLERLIANFHVRGDDMSMRVFAHGDDCLKVLEIANSINQLKHLVITHDKVVKPTMVNKSKLVFKKVVPCLKGLTSLTMSVRDPELLRKYGETFLRASQQIPSITNMGFYRLDIRKEKPAKTPLVDVTQWKVEIPEHITVTTGAWTLEREKETLRM